jgi:hypothetical protein
MEMPATQPDALEVDVAQEPAMGGGWALPRNSDLQLEGIAALSLARRAPTQDALADALAALRLRGLDADP